MEVPQGRDFAGSPEPGWQKAFHAHSLNIGWERRRGGEQRLQCWGGWGGHLFLPLELAKQDEVRGGAREGGGAPDAGRVGDGDEEALPDVSAIVLLLLGVGQKIQRGLGLLGAVLAFKQTRRDAIQNTLSISGLRGILTAGAGKLRGLSRREFGRGIKNL